ncbi:MAG TPA: HEAT repeat domain-containing protein [Phototrophicaceae bacterium]|nr:HEAT repeat domain-containing protein [Phototrophicaceae bacterium]
MGQHVFVSYKHEDNDFATMVIRQLQLAGFQIWIDTEQLRAGENWRESINYAIKEALALVLIISPEARASEYVTYEWAFAQGAGVKIVPILVRPTDRLHPQLEMLQYLDFTDRARPPWDKLIRRLWEIQGENQPYTVSVARDAPPAVKSAVAAMDSHNAEERRQALKSLAQMNHPAAYAALVGAVQHPMRDVRVDAAFLLAKQTNHQERAAVPGLLDALHDEDVRLRTAAVKALGDIGDASAVPELLLIMNHDADGNIRWQASGALSKIGEAAVPGLAAALKDEDWKVRRSAAEALSGMREPVAVPALIDAMTDRNDVVRQAVASALESMGAMAVPTLIEKLMSRDVNVARTAAELLPRINTPEANMAYQRWAGKTAPLPEPRRNFPPR